VVTSVVVTWNTQDQFYSRVMNYECEKFRARLTSNWASYRDDS